MKKAYTAEQLCNAEKLAQVLAGIPTPEKRNLTVMMTNSFVAGMEAQKAINDTMKATV